MKSSVTMKFLTIADWTGTVEPEWFSTTYRWRRCSSLNIEAGLS
jgi:hypothetical protein